MSNVFTTIFIPFTIWRGTITFNPFSRIAGLRPEVAVCPLITASASLISKVIVSGSKMFIGLSSFNSRETLIPSFKSFYVSEIT